MRSLNIRDSEVVKNKAYLLFLIQTILSQYETIISTYYFVIQRQRAFPTLPAVKERIPALPTPPKDFTIGIPVLLEIRVLRNGLESCSAALNLDQFIENAKAG
jgi:hypothetical protein